MLYYQTRCCDFCETPLDLTDPRNYGDPESRVDLCSRCQETYRDFLRLDQKNIFCRVGEWNTADDELSCRYMTLVLNGFHDFHLLGVSYEQTGTRVSEDGGLDFSCEADCSVLTLRFLGWSLKDSPICEVRFTGVEGYSIRQASPPYELLGAAVSPVEIPAPWGHGSKQRLLVWAQDDRFDPTIPIDRQTCDCVVAQTVAWRWLEREGT